MKFLLTASLLLALSCVSQAEETPRNILLLVSDDLKAGVLGCYGDSICSTPNIDRLAEQGMVFERAFCQGTVCGPSRRSFMRSRYHDKDGITLGENLINQGYYSARVGKIFHMRVPGDIIAGTDGDDVAECWTERFNSKGLEAHTPGNYSCLNLNIFTTDLEDRQSTRMPHRMFVAVDYEGDGSDQPDFKTADQTVKLLRQQAEAREKTPDTAKPFFIAAGFVRPHYPSVAPEQYFTPYPYAEMPLPEAVDGDLDDIPAPGISSSNSKSTGIGKYPDNQRRMWSAYYATVTFLDEQVGRVIDELERLGLRESTTIVFISDHGYLLGEHTFWQKNNLRDEVLRVPMIIDAPGFDPGRSDSIVELADMYPTVCELSGASAPDSVVGKSLVKVLADPEIEVRRAAYSYAKGGASLSESDLSYMRYKDDSEELYDMKADPKQFTNLAKDPAQAKRLKDFRRRIDAKSKR